MGGHRSLQSTIGRRYVSTAQVLQVVQRLPSIDLLRVEGIISLFGRIVDLDKFHELWRELTHEEGDELIHRIGYLNAGNPMAMEWGGRVYKLNLKIPDEYKMAEALVKLAILEPGTNWVGERFKQKGDQ